MSEMAVTASELIVVGRGRLIASGSVDEVIRAASGGAVLVRTREAERLAALLAGEGRRIEVLGPDTLQISGMESEAVGLIAAQAAIAADRTCSATSHPEEAFMEITRDAVESTVLPSLARMTTIARRWNDLGQGRVTLINVIRSEWIKLRSLRFDLVHLLANRVSHRRLGHAVQCGARAPLQPRRRPRRRLAGFDPTQVSLRGVFLAQLAIGVLGVLVITGEYSTGMIRSSIARGCRHRRSGVRVAKALCVAFDRLRRHRGGFARRVPAGRQQAPGQHHLQGVRPHTIERRPLTGQQAASGSLRGCRHEHRRRRTQTRITSSTLPDAISRPRPTTIQLGRGDRHLAHQVRETKTVRPSAAMT